MSYTAADDVALRAALAGLRQRLQACLQAAPGSEPPDEGDGILLPPALGELGRQFGLTPFEQKTLLLCAAVEFEPALAGLYAQLHQDPASAYPTFALALSVFEGASWDVLSPNRPLRYWQLIELAHLPDRPLTITPLRADERIVNLLKGLNEVDQRLAPYVLAERQPGFTTGELALTQEALVEQACAALRPGGARVVQLVGPDPVSKQLVARAIARRQGLQLYRMPVTLLPPTPRDLEDFARLWQRESMLLPLALFVDAGELDRDQGADEHGQRLRQFLYRCDSIILLDTRDVLNELGRSNIALDVRKPAPSEQADAWRQALQPAGSESGPFAAQLAAQFNLNLPGIADIARQALVSAGDWQACAWQACLDHTRPRLDLLAQRIIPRATWDDIALSPDRMNILRHIADQVERRSTVYDAWGFRRSSRGLGITVLFSGESGTGKTMAAEILANQLRLNLYRIDLSAVVSKYIGETEKNLRQLFDAAEDGGAVLFFDEADALFGKRSEVRDSHDRYANIEVSYLLQRLEAFQGLAVLATNLQAGLDDAFSRRLRFVVAFPRPDETHRQRIWRRIFPPQTPLGELDYAYLAARFNLSGGSIYNIALNAAFMAAQAGARVSMPHVLEAINIEMLKEGRMLNERDLVWPRQER